MIIQFKSGTIAQPQRYFGAVLSYGWVGTITTITRKAIEVIVYFPKRTMDIFFPDRNADVRFEIDE